MKRPSKGDFAPPELRPAAVSDTARLARVLARAFLHDPVQRWVYPSEADYLRKAPRIFSLVLETKLPYGTVDATADGQAVALWDSPEHPHPSPRETAAMVVRGTAILGRNAPRMGRCMYALEKMRPSYPHWYLFLIGTDPGIQGRGHASALLGSRLHVRDGSGIPAYLEASSTTSVPLYERHGFRVIGEIHLPNGPTLYRMLRSPGGGG